MSSVLISSTLTTNQVRAGSKRIQVIDALRGFALFGILLTHSTYTFLYTISEPTSYSESGSLSILDLAIKMAVQVFVTAKVYNIFSFLFGLSFAIQLQSAISKGKPFIGRFIWRLTILSVIGHFHSRIYGGDILQIYAILGLVLLVCTSLKDKELLLISALLFIVSIAATIYKSELSEVINPLAGAARESELLRFIGLPRFGFQILSGRLFVTVSLFLLGLYVGRYNIFSDTLKNRMLFKKILILSSIAALVSTAIVGLTSFSGIIPDIEYLTATSIAIQKVSLSSFYVAIIVKLYQVKLFHKILQWLVPVGQMGLSIYIIQSLFLQFYGLGPDIITKIGLTAAIGITALFFLVQILFASWWMSHYRFGPLEWLWRTLIYFRWQPIQKSSIANVMDPENRTAI